MHLETKRCPDIQTHNVRMVATTTSHNTSCRVKLFESVDMYDRVVPCLAVKGL